MFKWNRVDAEAPSDRADFIREWIKELFYGNKKQIPGFLSVVKDGQKCMCCLGVASEQAGLSWWEAKSAQVDKKNHSLDNVYAFQSDEHNGEAVSYLPAQLVAFLGLHNSVGSFTASFDRSGISKRKQVLEFVNKHGYRVKENSCFHLAELNDSNVKFTVIALVIREFTQWLFSNLSSEEEVYIRDTILEDRK